MHRRRKGGEGDECARARVCVCVRVYGVCARARACAVLASMASGWRKGSWKKERERERAGGGRGVARESASRPGGVAQAV